VLENNIPIDTKYYLENQLSKPLMRVFEPILGDKAASLCTFRSRRLLVGSLDELTVAGDHTRAVRVATPTVGGLMKFAVKTVTCLGCKTPLRANNSLAGTQFLIGLQVASLISGFQVVPSAIIVDHA
jgi:DNA polymerase delta subunit 1